MTNEATGADLKSATEQDSKKLFIETYGCQMNVGSNSIHHADGRLLSMRNS